MEGRKVDGTMQRQQLVIEEEPQGAHEQFGMAPSAEVGVRSGKWLDCLGVR